MKPLLYNIGYPMRSDMLTPISGGTWAKKWRYIKHGWVNNVFLTINLLAIWNVLEVLLILTAAFSSLHSISPASFDPRHDRNFIGYIKLYEAKERGTSGGVLLR